MMNRPLYIFALLSLAAASANATLLTFIPSNTDLDIGDSIAVDIVATPEAGELIGAFDFIVNFDPSVIAFLGLTFGPSLNDDDFFCSVLACRGFSSAGGEISLFEASLVFPLTSLQDGTAPVVLATLVFDAIGAGASDLTFTGNILGQAPPFNLLGDDFGVPLPVLEPGTGRITVLELDSDGDGVLDTDDNCVNTPNSDQADADADGIGNACDDDDDNDGDSDVVENACGSNPLDPAETCANVDTDNDGVANVDDVCADTEIPELPVPIATLKKNRYALKDNAPIFDGQNNTVFTTADTGGCSCEQIIDELGLGGGHIMFGCSKSAMQQWIDQL